MAAFRHKRRLVFVRSLWVGLAIISCCSAQPPLPPDMHDSALAVIDNIYNNRFEKAEAVAEKIIKTYPDHPAGFFFKAATLYSWMMTNFSKKREDEFYLQCESAIEKGGEMSERVRNDQWSRFFIAGAEGLKGIYEYHQEHWITAFRSGWKGMSILKDLRAEHCSLPDLDYGIGSYEYWRSALSRRLWWMPPVSDQREAGIEKLREAIRSGVYVQAFARECLVEIFLNEKEYDEALALADESLQRYPDSRKLLFWKASALFGLHKYEETAEVFRRILQGIGAPADDGEVAAYCRLWLGKIDFQEWRYQECLAELDSMQRCKITAESSRGIRKCFDEAAALAADAKKFQDKALQERAAAK